MTGTPGGLVFLPLGGSGEIGMNFNLYGYDGQWILVDCGVSFGDESMPGIDVFMADPAFIVQRRDKLLGIVLTHAHEDHLGAVPYLWPQLGAPVYATPFAAAMLRSKLEEAKLLGQVEIHEVPQGGRIGRRTVHRRSDHRHPFLARAQFPGHSYPRRHRAPYGRLETRPSIRCSGPTADLATMKRLGDEGVLAVVGDSTNVFVPGAVGSEGAVREALIVLFGQCKGRIAVACFATNVARLTSIAAAAAAHGRRIALSGRSLWRIDRAARALGMLDGVAPFLDDTEASALPPHRVCYVCTGSQGEPRAALPRIASGAHAHVKLGRGDTVIFSSRIIPGNERPIYRLHNQLARLGVEVDHREGPFRPCVRPSGPRRDRRALRTIAAGDGGAHSWRAPPSRRTCKIRG